MGGDPKEPGGAAGPGNRRPDRRGSPDSIPARRLPLGVVRAVETAVGTRLRTAVDDLRRAGMTWAKIADRLNESGHGRYKVTGDEIRRFAAEAGVDLAPGPGREPPQRVVPARERRGPRPRTEPSALASEALGPGTVAHAVAHLRQTSMPGRATRRVDQTRVTAYVRGLDHASREQLLVGLLLAKLKPVPRPVVSPGASTVSVRTVSGGLPSLGKGAGR